MRKRRKPWWVGVALVVLGCSSSDHPPMLDANGTVGPLPDSADGRLRGGACPVALPLGYSAHCGTLTVPENRSSPGARTIDLSVMVLDGKVRNATPVVYLEGGPGGRAIDDVVGLIDYFAPILDRHDLVVFDQRGTGYDAPSLDCPEICLLYTSDAAD